MHTHTSQSLHLSLGAGAGLMVLRSGKRSRVHILWFRKKGFLNIFIRFKYNIANIFYGGTVLAHKSDCRSRLTAIIITDVGILYLNYYDEYVIFQNI